MSSAEIQLKKRTMDSATMNVYRILIAASVILSIAGFYWNNLPYAFVSAAIAVIIVFVMSYDKTVIHIPPMMLVLSVLFVAFNIFSQVLIDHPHLETVGYFFLGMILSLCGFVVAYAAVGRMPGSMNERSVLMGLEAFTFGIATFALGMTVARFCENVSGMPDYHSMFDNMLAVIIGSAVICMLYLLEEKHIRKSYAQMKDPENGIVNMSVKHTLFNLMYANSETFGINQDTDRYAVYEIADTGETERTEFKSTLRLNLRDPGRKKDSRMERAVLKTIVAFLNTDGGDLLIGVNDDGKIIGIDEEYFENRDKMNLHMTNLLSSQIGSEFLPYIKFEVVEFDPSLDPDRFEVRQALLDKGMNPCVMRVRCKKCPKPVFLNDGKEEIYFARSGPSSVELTGSNLIRYIATKRRLQRVGKSPIVGIAEPSVPDDVPTEKKQ